MKKYLQILIKVSSIIVFFIIWKCIDKLVNNNFVLPDISDVAISLKEIIVNNMFFSIIGNTLYKLMCVIVITLLISTITGILSFKYPIFKEIIVPYVSVIKAIPTVALIILVLVWFNPNTVPIIVGVMIIFPILYDNILNGIEGIDKSLIMMSTTFGISWKRRIFELYIPSVYYYIAGGIHSLIGLAFKVIIAGEIISQESFSIGGEILLNKVYLETSNIFAWVIVVIGLNFFIEKTVILLNNRLMSWR